MLQIALIGIAAGIASALLFASIASGSLLSISLFYLAPLPVMIASLGWSHLSGLIAAMVAAAGLAAVFGGLFFMAFLATVGLPAWWLGYLALLARPTASPPGGREWYPIGRLVVWAALIGTLVVALATSTFGFDAASFRSGLRQMFERILAVDDQAATNAPVQVAGIADLNQLLDFLVAAIPPTAAVLSMLTNLGNLWVGARIVKVSGRLRREWPDLAAIAFPKLVAIALAAATAGTFLPGAVGELPDMVGILSGVLAATLVMAYAIAGLAVLHAITRGVRGRGLILAGTYATIFVFGWPILAMALTGLADVALDVRGRIARRRGPPAVQ